MRRLLWIFGLLALVMLVIPVIPIGGFAAETAQAQGGITVITNSILNLRAGPGTNFEVLASVPARTKLTAFARNEASDWVRVEFNGLVGWLAVRYLTLEGRVRTLPTGDVPPPGTGGGSPGESGGPVVAPTATPKPKDGDLLGLSLYASTDAVNYYRITYYSEGLRVNGFMTEPREPGKYPALIFNRGGNRDVGALNGWEFIPFAEAKFVVVATQYRGGGGSEGYDNLGGADVNDVLNLIPLLKSREQVDSSRIVMYGTSRGGMMTYIALRKLAQAGRGDIRAAATASGIADLFMWAKERPDLDGGAYQDLVGASTKSNPAAFRERSATYWPQLIRAPLLIMHGSLDDVVSAEQSKALYSKMRGVGRVANLLILPGADHGLTAFDGGAPYALTWFGQYIGRAGENYDFEFYKPAIEKAFAIIRGR